MPSNDIEKDEALRRLAKKELRKRMLSLRLATPEKACALRSLAIENQLLSLELMQHVKSVALFWPIKHKHEVDLREFAKKLWMRSVKLAFPALEPDYPSLSDTPESLSTELHLGQETPPFSADLPKLPRSTKDLAMRFRFVDWSKIDVELTDQGFGFMQPSSQAPLADGLSSPLDLIIVPAMAVSISGHRIGYGKGYYDRYLKGISASTATVTVVYDYQLLAEIPYTKNDVALQWIVTDKRSIRCET